jgi:hypothetical protein
VPLNTPNKIVEILRVKLIPDILRSKNTQSSIDPEQLLTQKETVQEPATTHETRTRTEEKENRGMKSMNPAHLLRRPSIRRAAGGQHQEEEEAARGAMRANWLTHQGSVKSRLGGTSTSTSIVSVTTADGSSQETSVSGAQRPADPWDASAREEKICPVFFSRLFLPFPLREKREGEGEGGRCAAAGRWGRGSRDLNQLTWLNDTWVWLRMLVV